MQKYVVERGNGTHKILEQQGDGTYIVIGLSAGDDKLANVVEMVNHANSVNQYWNAKLYPALHGGCTVDDITGECRPRFRSETPPVLMGKFAQQNQTVGV